MSAVCKLAIFCLALLAAGTMAQLPDAPATANDAGFLFGYQTRDGALRAVARPEAR